MTRTGFRLTLLALLAWLSCFVVLARFGTWLPFAFVGVALAFAAIRSKVAASALPRPTLRACGVGTLFGLVMVVGTHLAYAGACALIPSVRGKTVELLALLNVVGFSALERALLIVVIASCEEVLFRGPLPLHALRSGSARVGWPVASEMRNVLAFAALYAMTSAPLHSPLLIACAFVCGTVWGVMRISTGLVLVPVLAHVIWDLGVLIVWPLSTLPS